MATTIKKLTGMGGDVRKIAALLQKKAPPGHRLAYINDEEAALLKARGGSGKPHADTGIPSYQEDDVDIGFGPGQYQPTETEQPSAPVVSSEPLDVFSQQYQNYTTMPTVAPAPVAATDVTGQARQLESFPIPQAPSAYGARDIALGEAALTTPAAPAAGAGKEEGMSKDTMTRLGLAGALGLIGSRTASRAAAQGQAGKAEMQALAAPYQKQGAEIQAAAQRGELTPAGQQSLQAARAQAAQAAETRGGVGAAQAMQQVEAFRQQLLAQQYDYGLKLSGIGDNIALGAIKTGLQADQYVNQLNNAFYTNMAYIASGTSPGIRIGGST